jgi:phage terminase small subunit
MGKENLQKPAIQAEIAVIQQDRSQRRGITADKVVDEYAKIAFSDIDLRFTSVADKIRALDSLARHLGLFNDRLNLNLNLTLEQLVTQSLEQGHDDQD